MVEPLAFERERRTMIEYQLRRRGLRDERVLEAMLRVPRHEFVSASYLHAAYEDRPLPIGETETISQPYIVAAMTQAVEVHPGDRALEIGTGSGYQTALLAQLGAKVYSVERSPQLAEAARARLARLGVSSVEVLLGDGSEGYAPEAPYQVIVVTAAAPNVPQPLLDQLAEGGRMVIPVGDQFHQVLVLISKEKESVSRRTLDACQFVPLIGKHGWIEKK